MDSMTRDIAFIEEEDIDALVEMFAGDTGLAQCDRDSLKPALIRLIKTTAERMNHNFCVTVGGKHEYHQAVNSRYFVCRSCGLHFELPPDEPQDTGPDGPQRVKGPPSA